MIDDVMSLRDRVAWAIYKADNSQVPPADHGAPFDCDLVLADAALAVIAGDLASAEAEIRREYDANLYTYGGHVEPGSRDPFAEAAMDTYRLIVARLRGES